MLFFLTNNLFFNQSHLKSGKHSEKRFERSGMNTSTLKFFILSIRETASASPPLFPGPAKTPEALSIPSESRGCSAGRRRVDAHGPEWKQACADLAIPNEARCHVLPFKRRKVQRKYFYACPECATVLARVLPLRRKVACVKCCRKFNGGVYQERFRFKPVEPPVEIAA